MIKHILLSLSVLSLLQACGGGGDGDADPAALSLNAPAAEVPAAADIGSVSARFVPNENVRAMLVSMSDQSVGPGEASEQTDSGAMVRLGSNTLSGTHQTVDIAGDTHFALGRWVKGTVTRPSGSYTLEGNDPESYHYLAFNGLTALPASGQLQCTTVAATAPTALSDTHEKVGLASGSASLSFDPTGAAIQGEIQVRAGAESATVNLPLRTDAASMSISGLLLANGPGAALVLADQGSEVPGFVVWYKAQLPGGVLYTGVARFACSSM